MIRENNWHPGELLSVSSAYWRGCTLQAAVRLNIFSLVKGGQLSAKDIAKELGADERATGLLLDGLAGMGLLNKTGEMYGNSEVAEQYLVNSSPDYMGHIILHHHHLLDGWAQLDQAILSGQRVATRSYGDDVERESFIMGMFNLAMMVAPSLATQINLAGRTRLLDLGGGPGTWAIAFCKENPSLSAVIFDRPTTEHFARDTVAKFGLGERIDFQSGDFTRDDITGGPYDVAWLSHILHSNSYEECCKLISSCVSSMVSGGLIMVHDFILDDSKDGPEFPALFSLNMLLAGNDGRSYSEVEIRNMLERAGVTDIRRHPFRAKNDSSIMMGVVG